MMIDWLRELYRKARKPTALGLVVVSIAARFTPYPQLQYGAIVALLLITLQILFEIHSKQEAALAADWIDNYHDAIPRMRAAIEQRASHRGKVKVQWWGVTLEVAWPVIQNLLSKSFAQGHPKCVHVELAMLSPHGLTAQRIDAATQRRLSDMLERIANFKGSNDKQFTALGSSLEIYTYDFLPQAHVLLLDDDMVFWSYARPLDGAVMGPEGGVAVARADSGPEAADRIHAFREWMRSVARASSQGRGDSV